MIITWPAMAAVAGAGTPQLQVPPGAQVSPVYHTQKVSSDFGVIPAVHVMVMIF
jgi:hypothetical protein